MNTLKINVPEGFEIDKDKSTFEEIVFKPIKTRLPKRWEDLGVIRGYYVDLNSSVILADATPHDANRNIFATKEQAKAAIALAQLSQLREVYRQGWVPDWNTEDSKYVIESFKGKISTEKYSSFSSSFLSFQSEQVRDEFLRNFKDLIEEASPLLFG